jgi:hypothetical protein
VLSSGAEGLNVRFRSIALLLCLLFSLNAFAVNSVDEIVLLLRAERVTDNRHLAM